MKILVSLFVGLIVGILLCGSILEYESRKVIDGSLMLQVPKDNEEIAKQILYSKANLAMLEELLEQRLLKESLKVTKRK